LRDKYSCYFLRVGKTLFWGEPSTRLHHLSWWLPPVPISSDFRGWKIFFTHKFSVLEQKNLIKYFFVGRIKKLFVHSNSENSLRECQKVLH